jgi:hypothetical protein
MSVATDIDHVGLSGASPEALAALYEKLGFTLTPQARQEGKPVGDRCIMFAQGYLALSGAAEPGVIALGVADAEAALARLQRAGMAVPEPVAGVRLEARFVTLKLEAPEGQLALIQHDAPDALRPTRFSGHANHTVALQEVTIATTAPAETAVRFSRLAGRPVTPDPQGGYVLELAQSRVRMWPGGPVCGVAGLCFRTDDRNAALRRRLAYWGMPHDESALGVTLQAGGLSLRFQAG